MLCPNVLNHLKIQENKILEFGILCNTYEISVCVEFEASEKLQRFPLGHNTVINNNTGSNK